MEIKTLHNMDLGRKFNTAGDVEIDKSEDFNLDQPYIIDYNGTGYFYANEKERNEDLETILVYCRKLQNAMFN